LKRVAAGETLREIALSYNVDQLHDRPAQGALRCRDTLTPWGVVFFRRDDFAGEAAELDQGGCHNRQKGIEGNKGLAGNRDTPLLHELLPSPDLAPVQKRLRSFSAQFYDFRPVRAQIAPWAQSTITITERN
jgi:hypothetical protein